MLRSLRTRLTLLFAGTLLLATVIAGAASIRLYQSYNRDQTANELRSQVGGAAQYFDTALNAYGHSNQRSAHPRDRRADREHLRLRRALCRRRATVPELANKLIEFAGKVKLNWLTMKPDDRVTFQF